MNSKTRRSSQKETIEYQQLEARQLLATFTVNTSEDIANAIPDGQLSLREAIIAANTNQAYGDAPAGDAGIDFIRSGIGHQPILISAELPIIDDVSIRGFSLDAQESSRIFRIQNSGMFALSRSILQNGRADTGGAIYSLDTELELTNVEFFNNRADAGNGGAIKIKGGSLQTDVSTFDGNAAVGNGGAISIENGYWEDLSSNFNNNFSAQSGGAIHNKGGVIKLESSHLTFNTADGNGSHGGGALFSEQSATNTFTKLNFENNRAPHGNGGAILGRNSNGISVRESDFLENSAGKNGGAVHLDNDNFFVVANQFDSDLQPPGLTSFEKNAAAQNGGAISATKGSYVVMAGIDSGKNVAGTADSASHGKGGVIYSVDSSIEINGDSVKLSGWAYHAGGAIAVIGGRLRMISGLNINPDDLNESYQATKDSRIFGYMPASDSELSQGMKVGGNIYAVDAKVKISGFRIGGLTLSSTERGGGLFLSNSRASLDNTLLYANGARFGGGIFATNQSWLVVDQSLIHSDYSWKGSGVFVNEFTKATVNGSRISGRAFHSGGGFYNKGSLIVNRSGFSQNVAYDSGQYLQFDNDSSLRPGQGAAIYSSGNLLVSDSSFEDGYAGSGGAIAGSGVIAVYRSNFENNRATLNPFEYRGGSGGAIVSSAHSLTLRSVRFTSNVAAYGGAVSVNGGVLYGRNLIFGGDTEESGNKTYRGNVQVRGEGGALRLSGYASATLVNATFKNNSASTLGGAIAIVANSQIVPYLFASRARFLNNSVISGAPTETSSNLSLSGGAIANDGGNLDLRDSWFIQNSAAGHGGAIANGSFGRTELRNIQIRESHADLLGGAIFNDAQLDLFDSIISDNDAAVGFGGIFESLDSTTSIVRTQFDDNSL